jgi:hypothetical protein
MQSQLCSTPCITAGVHVLAFVAWIIMTLLNETKQQKEESKRD